MDKKKRRNIIVLMALVVALSWCYFEFYYYVHINIKFIAEVEANSVQIEDKRQRFIVLTADESRNWYVEKGLELPEIDFEKNYMVISRFEIKELKRKRGLYDNGMQPLGEAEFLYNKNMGVYYIYQMDKIYIGQIIDIPGGLH